jgi:predicted O-methyltransferase YrrM
MLFSQFRIERLAELHAEQWGNIRIPDLMEVFSIAQPERVLEIGSYRGVSTEFWALHCEKVVSIDPSPNMAVRRDLHARLAHYPHVKLIEARAPLDMPDLHYQFDFDLVYLDGDHSFNAVAAEIRAFKPLLRHGGWIGGHDYTDTPAPGDGVKEAVDNLLGIPPWRFSDGSWLVQIED